MLRMGKNICGKGVPCLERSVLGMQKLPLAYAIHIPSLGVFQKMKSKKSNQPISLGKTLNQARKLVDTEDFAGAVRLLVATEKMYPNNVELLELLGNCEGLNGNFESAANAYKKILRINTQHLKAIFGLAAASHRMGKLHESLRLYCAAFALAPYHPVFYAEIPVILKRLVISGEQWQTVVQIFKHCTDLDALLSVAIEARLQGQGDIACTLLDRVIEYDPGSSKARFELATAWKEGGQSERALAVYLSYTNSQYTPELRSQAWVEAGRCYMLLKDYESARQAFHNAKQSNGDNLLADSFLASLYLESGEFKQAEEQLLKTLGVHHENQQGWFTLAQTYICMRKIDPWFHAMSMVDKCSIQDQRLVQWNAVNRAVGLYLANRLMESHAMLVKNQGIFIREDNGSKFYRIYAGYVFKLLLWREKNQDWFGVGKEDALMHVIGESHALSLNYGLLDIEKSVYRSVSHWIPGIKMWHLVQKGANRFRSSFDSIIAQLPQGCNVMICMGEIDARPNEGIWAHSRSVGMPPAQFIVKTVAGFVEYLAEMQSLKKISRIIVQGVPAPAFPLSGSFDPGDQAAYLQMVKDFNLELKRAVIAASWCFIDVYAATVGEDDKSNLSWHIDHFHIHPGFYANVEKWLVKS